VLYYESFKYVYTPNRVDGYCEAVARLLLLNHLNNKIATPKISHEQCELLMYRYSSADLNIIKRYCYC